MSPCTLCLATVTRVNLGPVVMQGAFGIHIAEDGLIKAVNIIRLPLVAKLGIENSMLSFRVTRATMGY